MVQDGWRQTPTQTTPLHLPGYLPCKLAQALLPSEPPLTCLTIFVSPKGTLPTLTPSLQPLPLPKT